MIIVTVSVTRLFCYDVAGRSTIFFAIRTKQRVHCTRLNLSDEGEERVLAVVSDESRITRTDDSWLISLSTGRRRHNTGMGSRVQWCTEIYRQRLLALACASLARQPLHRSSVFDNGIDIDRCWSANPMPFAAIEIFQNAIVEDRNQLFASSRKRSTAIYTVFHICY